MAAVMELEVPDGINIDVGSLLAVDTRQGLEGAIEERCRPAVEALIQTIFALPSELTDDGRAVILPRPLFILPREKPVPRERSLTKWETYAKEKGIQKKKKRDRLVWDEATQDFLPRYGKGSTTSLKLNAILPHSDNLKPGEDPFTAAKRAKKNRTKDNKKQQHQNLGRSRKKTKKNILNPIQALDVAAPGPTGRRHIPKAKLRDTISVAQRSTASAGRFDTRLKNEPKAKVRGHKRKLPESNTAKEKLVSERDRSRKVLERVLQRQT